MTHTQLELTTVQAHLTQALGLAAEQLRRVTVRVGNEGSGGSGIIWRSDGLVITNAHVIRGVQTTVQLWDGRSFTAKVTAQDSHLDLAALQIAAADLPVATIGQVDALRVGDLVLAVGNPLGLKGAIALGVVQAKPDLSRSAWVQADIRLAPGNSGGPLANAQGAVIGVNTMIADGLALAVPSTVVEQFLSELRSGNRLTLGIQALPVQVSSGRKASWGLLILAISPGSATAAADLLIGDVLLGVEGRRFSSPNDLVKILRSTSLDTSLRVELARAGQTRTHTIHPAHSVSHVATEAAV
ncbi:S1C family serine protease [Leptolyngbya sp. FACHB-261]|uniref:S1C family serine protease n=1 Tax=Leptolyngbya sp. FACHB-261 TaxID=2692806 RepID=UPI0016821D2F|nr:trypsin-like peptidase domain-containing protein [Leptolyngbya sp. FACHB-261]MBD2099897.1 trypsin-like peptidase domain-containing protein [Leptolyngbya sp. FACHB-261]